MDLEKLKKHPNCYYHTDLGVLLKADCNDIKFDDKSVDLTISDPPYGIQWHSGHYKNGNPFEPIKGDDRYPIEIIPKLKQLTKKAIFLFCRWDNLYDVEKPMSFIVWVKNLWTAGGDIKHSFGRQWEGILFYPMEKHLFNYRPPDIIQCAKVFSGHLVHPTQKPLKLIKWILQHNSIEGDLVFDPYFGSGTTGLACEQMKRRWIGIEDKESYCIVAKKRIEAEFNQGKFSF